MTSEELLAKCLEWEQRYGVRLSVCRDANGMLEICFIAVESPEVGRTRSEAQ